MSHDDLTLSLIPPPAMADAVDIPEPPRLEVMARLIRLPTRSLRQARSIVRMQMDRLSPLPMAEVVFDLVLIRAEGAETLYGLGIIRKGALADPAPGGKSIVEAHRTVEGHPLVFRYRSPNAVNDWELRWLKHAPTAAVLVLGLAAVLWAGQVRSDAWRERRLPEIAAAQRHAAKVARDAEQQSQARGAWLSLDRADAATRLTCVAAALQPAAPGQGLPVTSIQAAPDRVVLTAATDRFSKALADAGGAVVPAGPPPSGIVATFTSEACR